MNASASTEIELIAKGQNYAYSFTRNLHDAEDLVQQAWLKLKTKYGEVEDHRILFRAIRNLFIDGTRRAKVVRFEPLEDREWAIGKSESFGAASDVESALSILSPAERLSIKMSYLDGFTATEISAKTGIPRGTVLSHTHRAKKKLFAKFGDELSTTRESLARAG